MNAAAIFTLAVALYFVRRRVRRQRRPQHDANALWPAAAGESRGVAIRSHQSSPLRIRRTTATIGRGKSVRQRNYCGISPRCWTRDDVPALISGRRWFLDARH
jgi:hypothetical protein